jgi:hypothetical protein
MNNVFNCFVLTSTIGFDPDTHTPDKRRNIPRQKTEVFVRFSKPHAKVFSSLTQSPRFRGPGIAWRRKAPLALRGLQRRGLYVMSTFWRERFQCFGGGFLALYFWHTFTNVFLIPFWHVTRSVQAHVLPPFLWRYTVSFPRQAAPKIEIFILRSPVFMYPELYACTSTHKA